MNLYELSAEYTALYDALDRIEDESEIDTLISQCDKIEDTIKQKAISLACVCKRLAADAAFARHEKERLSALQKQRERECERLKQYIFSCMTASGLTKISDIAASLSIRKNPESVKVYDVTAALGSGYIKEQRPDESWLDKVAIKAAIQSGEDVPGCKLILRQSLTIK